MRQSFRIVLHIVIFTFISKGICMESKPYGTWKSPITSDLLVKDTLRFGDVKIDQETIYWIESRPEEKGRSVLMHESKKGVIEELILDPLAARTTVHEYGGGSFGAREGIIFFSNYKDQQLYLLNGEPSKLTKGTNTRYADGVLDKKRNKIFAVEEVHIAGDHIVNRLVAIDVGTGAVEVFASGHDFYSSPTLSPDGTSIAYLTWDHPNMPWDGTTLWEAKIGSAPRKISGGKDESIFQPLYSPTGDLYYISDRSGFWNLYRVEGDKVESIYPAAWDFGEPQWIFGTSRYVFIKDKIACIYTNKGIDTLALIDLKTKNLTRINLDFTAYSHLQATKEDLVFLASSPTKPSSLLAYNIKSQALRSIRKSQVLSIDTQYLSIPELISFPTSRDKTAYGFYYPPQNPNFTAPKGELPPLIVRTHGGPTAHYKTSCSVGNLYWTSRGFGVLEVNYGGSSGYGRDYRRRLNNSWGIVDVDDCVNGALYLAEKGRVDKNRLIIKGGSAGGFTTLAALTFRDVFKAGASYYGVSDLSALATHTHKFEARYLDTLIGPYPEEKKKYDQFSPILHTDRLSCPIILLQGDEDKVVPKEQSEKMYLVLKEKKIPTSYLLFEGEQHGFRQAKNIQKAIEAELYFYSRVFNFLPADILMPVPIDNL